FFAIAVLYAFHTYGSTLDPLQGLALFWSDDENSGVVAQSIVVIGVWLAFGLNMLLRYAGMVPLMISRRGSRDPVAWLLVGRRSGAPVAGLLAAGGRAGRAISLLVGQAAGGNQYFTRSGFAFGVIASAWGYVLLFERARLSVPARVALGAAATAYAVVLVWA